LLCDLGYFKKLLLQFGIKEEKFETLDSIAVGLCLPKGKGYKGELDEETK